MIRAINVDKLRLDTGAFVLSVANMRAQAGAHTVLERIDLDVKRGTVTALIGPAGAGKSFTLACIAGAERATDGRVRYFGYEIRGRAQERIARLGIVRAGGRALPFADMTVLETITVGALLRRPRLARARTHAREIAAATRLADHLALRFSQLDDFARRRLELARALATDPQVLLADDLGADLEPAAFAELGALLANIHARGITIVAAARALDRCPLPADDIVTIERGKTAEAGDRAALTLRP